MQTNYSSDKNTEMLLERVLGLSVPSGKSHDDIWDAIEKKIASETKVVPMWSIQTVALRGIAASIVLAIAFSFSIYLSENTVSVGNGEKKIVFLPDNSQIQLNAATSISYNKLLWYFERSVELEGEAFFEVQKGSNFDVISSGGKVSVLGTSFNVFSRGSVYRVACFTGKVKVEDHASDNEVILTPGLSTDQEMTAFSFDVKKVATWKRNEFYFEGAQLEEVINEIGRQFDIKITTQDVSDRLYTGRFKGTDLYTALDLVCAPMGLEYHIDNNTITIKSTNTFN